MTKVVIRGAELDATSRPSPLLDSGTRIASTVPGERLAFERVRRGTRNPIDAPIDTAADGKRFCEIEFDSGLRIWMRSDELAESGYFTEQQARDGDGCVLDPVSDRTRGLGSVVIKTLRFFGLNADEAVTALARDQVVARLEAAPAHGHGLHRLTGAVPCFDKWNAVEHEGLKESEEKPWLLMLHGTNSSIGGSFGDLWLHGDGKRYARLREYYGGERILGFEHATLSKSPITNVLELLEALPDGLRLHLLSHSRGGLLGELLARGSRQGLGFDAADISAFRNLVTRGDNVLPADQEDVDNLEKLVGVMRKKNLSIERFVRVGCPARGTTLASGKLKRWLSLVLNAMDCVGVASLPLQITSDLLKAVLLGLADLDVLPGLRAQNPDSPFMRALVNSPRGIANERLTVIGGDTEAADILGRLKMLAIDAFFERENDLVVDTASMTGGAQRSRKVLRHLQKGLGINHFGYFRHDVSGNRIVDGLIADDARLVGFEEVDTVQNELSTDGIGRSPISRSAQPKPPIVYVIPGIMGTHLSEQGNRVWLDKSELILKAGFQKLRIAPNRLNIDEIDRDTYGSLVSYLAASHEVNPFPYDWRAPIEEAGALLNDALRAKLASIDTDKQPIRLVAHSMGGLVARAMMMRQDSVWGDICKKNKNSRLLMLGTPNRGSHAISLLLTGQEKLLRMLNVLDFRTELDEMVTIASGFQGALDMLPAGSDRDYHDPHVWSELLRIVHKDWPQPAKELLKKSRALREQLDRQELDPTRVFYVAGKRDQTPVGIQIEQRPGRSPRLKFMGTAEGDGRVPWAGGIPDGIACWYVPAFHGDIPNYRAGHDGFRDILETGDTRKLSRVPPVSRGGSELFELRPEPVNYLPNQRDLQNAALSTDPGDRPAASLPPSKIEINLTWGHLKNARFPVVVGHYVGDSILSAEGALDKAFNDALSARNALGRYPGAVGTAMVILREEVGSSDLPGAVVVGLGDVGNLAPGYVTSAIQAGVLEWAVSWLELNLTVPEGGNGLSFILVGTGAGGTSTRESCRSILAGVRDALSRLDEAQRERLQFRQLEIIELYEDRAHAAWKAVLDQLPTPAQDSLAHTFVPPQRGLRQTNDGRRRLLIDAVGEWWQPLKIVTTGKSLLFENVTDRARAELRRVDFHTQQVDMLVQASVRDTRRSQDLEIALFELLMPNELKEFAPRLTRLRLVLDPASAAYPWEMLVDRNGGADRVSTGQGKQLVPQSVKAGLIRQLVMTDFIAQPAMTKGYAALVIGDPSSEGQYRDLPAALQEAEAVSTLLADNGFEPKLLPRPDTQSVILSLFNRGYRILHFAGHGTPRVGGAYGAKLEADDEDNQNGMVIGRDQYLTATHIRQMRDVPELVFINCCHLGAVESQPQRSQRFDVMAAGFGVEFIRIGVRAVVAAGWAVDDEAAKVFAEVFYSNMLTGAEFGDAVTAARKATFESFPHLNTWAAYQCYGDPSFRLRHTRLGNRRASGNGAYASPQHLIAEGIDDACDDDVLARLERRASKLEMRDDPRVHGAFARGYRRCGNLARAIECMDAAVSSSRPDLAVTLDSAECLVDWRIEAGLANPKVDAELLATVEAGLAYVQSLHALHPPELSRSARLARLRKRRLLLQRKANKSLAGKWADRIPEVLKLAKDVPAATRATWLANAALAGLLIGANNKPWKPTPLVTQQLEEAKQLFPVSGTALDPPSESAAAILLLVQSAATGALDKAARERIEKMLSNDTQEDLQDTLKLLLLFSETTGKPRVPKTLRQQWEAMAATAFKGGRE